MNPHFSKTVAALYLHFVSCYSSRIARAEKNDNISSHQHGKAKGDIPKSGFSTPSRRRVWCFRAAAAAGIPILMLLACEAILRWSGLGYPTDFFLEREINGRASLIDNQEFGRRFFPPGLVRFPKPMAIPAQKPAGTLRVFVLGESAAMGDPQPRFGMARMLEVLLRERFPGREIEVVNGAMVAINSHVILPIARECAERQGDLWVIYMGNNEMIGPFGCISKFGAQAPPRVFIRSSLALKRTRVGQALDAGLHRLRQGSGPPQQWKGMSLWMDEQIQPGGKDAERVYEHFGKNLRAIVEAGRRAGVQILLCTVATNLKDCPPFKSVHSPTLSSADLQAWQTAYDQGLALERQGRFAEAKACYERALGLDRQFAELCFRSARCSLALGNIEQAQSLFREARDRDALQFRTDSRLNELIRQCAREFRGRGVELLDAEAVFGAASPQQVAGSEFFLEHVHLNPEGNYLLARTVAERTAPMLGLEAPAAPGGPGEWGSQTACFDALGFTDWNRFQLLDEIRQRLEQPPFVLQADHEEQLASLREQMQQLRSATKPFQIQRASQQAARAVARRPGDPDLRWNLAELLAMAGDASGAEQEWRAVIGALPHSHYAYYNLGKVFESRGQAAEALELYNQCVRIRPDDFDTRYALGSLLSREGRPAEAVPQLNHAVRQRSASLNARLELGRALQRANRSAEAARVFQEVLQLDPNNSEARRFLGQAVSGSRP